MWSWIKDTAGDLFTSKKALACMTGLLGWGLKSAGVDIDEGTLQAATALLGTYIVGQGLADAGKEKAKVEAQRSINDALRR